MLTAYEARVMTQPNDIFEYQWLVDSLFFETQIRKAAEKGFSEIICLITSFTYKDCQKDYITLVEEKLFTLGYKTKTTGTVMTIMWNKVTPN